MPNYDEIIRWKVNKNCAVCASHHKSLVCKSMDNDEIFFITLLSSRAAQCLDEIVDIIIVQYLKQQLIEDYDTISYLVKENIIAEWI